LKSTSKNKKGNKGRNPPNGYVNNRDAVNGGC